MAAAGTTSFTGVSSPLFRREPPQLLRKLNPARIQRISPRFAISINRAPATFVTAEKETTAEVKREEERSTVEAETEKRWEEKEEDQRRSGWKEYLEQAKELIGDGGGPPRWFSPLDCGSRRLDNSPLMLFLPGIDGTGLGLIAHHQKLGRIFDLRCLHIPAADRTPFTDLVKFVERTVRSEYERSPNRPIYLVGESLGGCLALAVAARNRDIDLVLILANPATSFSRSQLQLLTPLLEALPGSLSLALPNSLSLTAGEPLRMVLDNFVKGLPLQNTTREQIIGDITTFSSSLPVLADILPKETLLWKLKMSKSASEYANSRLYAIKAQTLILCSGNDQLLPSQQEGERLYKLIPNSELRKFDDSGHFLLLEGSIDLVTVLKGTSYYRRGKYLDYASDFILPTPYEAKEVIESHSLITAVTSAVMLSTLEDGTIVKGLAGIPSEGPVLFVGYHMLLGLELVPLVTRIFNERNILVRGLAHPMMFIRRQKNGRLPEKSTFDSFRIMGAVPVAPTNLFKLLSSKSHVLLYPGGMREALHRKGEEYKLFWPEQSEFIRMAARFGAKIVPFGAVGEDDLGQVVIDYDDYVKIPYFKSEIESLTNEAVQLRAGVDSEVANQQVYMPGILPKIPGRFYYYFGKPIETAGRKQELKDREKSQELYFEVKSEVERCIAYLKEKRESDPYRSILPRLLYQATHGFTSDIPTFEI